MSFLRKLNMSVYETATWIGHTIAVLVVGCVVAGFDALVGIWLIDAELSFLIGTVVAGTYFVIVREPQDKEIHLEEGNYDTPLRQSITPRVDAVGDMLGSVIIPVTGIVLYSIHLFPIMAVVYALPLLGVGAWMKVVDILERG